MRIVVALIVFFFAFCPLFSFCSDLDEQLREAVKSRDIQNASVLLDAGADVNARGSGGVTPLMQAVIRYGTPNGDLVDLLLEKGSTGYPQLPDK